MPCPGRGVLPAQACTATAAVPNSTIVRTATAWRGSRRGDPPLSARSTTDGRPAWRAAHQRRDVERTVPDRPPDDPVGGAEEIRNPDEDVGKFRRGREPLPARRPSVRVEGRGGDHADGRMPGERPPHRQRWESVPEVADETMGRPFTMVIAAISEPAADPALAMIPQRRGSSSGA